MRMHAASAQHGGMVVVIARLTFLCLNVLVRSMAGWTRRKNGN